MLHLSAYIYKGMVGRLALIAALIAAAIAVFLMSGGLGEGQETTECPDGVTADVCINFPEHGSGTVVAYTATDPEREDVTWELAAASVSGSEDRGLFSIDSSTGILTFITPPDFEAPGDAGTNNEYNVIIQATDVDAGFGTDSAGATLRPETRPVTRTLIVTVTDVEEAGVVTLTTLQPQEKVAIVAALRDPDGEPRTAAVAAAVPDTDKILTGESTTAWQWARSSRAAGPWTDIDGATSASHAPTGADVGMYLRATATYDDGQCGFSNGTATPCDPKKTAHAISANPVQADPGNKDPVFQDEDGNTLATTTRSIAENSEAGTAVGAPVAATDPGPDGKQETLTYAMSGSGADSFDIDSGTGQIRVKDALDFDLATSGQARYELIVTATDPSNATGSVNVTVMVIDVDEPPAIAAATQGAGHVSKEHEENTPADTEVSTYSAIDPDGDDAASLKWALSGRDAAVFRIGNYSDERGKLYFRESPNYEAPADSGRDNVYEVTVEVTDRGGNKASRDVTVSVTNLDEDGLLTVSNRHPQVGTRIIATLTDPDTPISNVDWTWLVQGADDGNTDTYTPKAADEGRTLEVEVSYTDGTGETQSEPLTLSGIQARPTGSNSSPRFPTTTSSRLTVSENQNAVTNVGAEVRADDTDGDDLTYSLSGGDGSFLINQDTGQISTRTTLDREKRSSYRVTITAEDPSGASDTHSLTIEVTNVNEPPAITSGDAPTVYYEENGRGSVAAYRAEDPEGSRIVWSLTGTDADSFTITNGVLRFKSPPDFETKEEYLVEINAGDGADGLDTEVITIKIDNVDEPGSVTLNHQPREAAAVTASLTDEDNQVSSLTWQWARSPSRSGPFTDVEDDENTTGETEGKEASYTPRKDDVGMYLRATATYEDGQGGGKSAFVISNARTLHKASAEPRFLDDDGAELATGDLGDNDPKTFTTQVPISREIAENARHGTNVGLPVEAVDIGDNGRPERLTYALDGADAAKFDIVTSNGQIRVKSGFTPDYEATAADDNCAANDDMCEVTVTVTDPTGNSNIVTVNIAITDVNEPPHLAVSSTAPAGLTGNLQSGYRLEEPVDGTARESGQTTEPLTITFLADDPETGANPNNDGDPVGGDDNSADLDWTLTGTDADDFNIAAGVLTFKNGPNYEAPTDSGGNNGYDVTVQVTDNGGNTVSQRVRIAVINVGEAGKIDLSHTQPEVEARLTATLTDPDNPRSINWRWYRGTVRLDSDGTVIDSTGNCSATGISAPCYIDRGGNSATYRPVVDDGTNVLTIVASYTDGHGSGKTAILTTAALQAEDGDNVAPQFLVNGERETRDTREVREDAAPNTNVGSAVAATDNDPGDTDNGFLVYTLSGTDARFFAIDSTTGQITVGADTSLDYEKRRSYRVTVRALDPSAKSAQITITINVIDVDELPVLSEKGLAALGDGNILYQENGTGVVGQYTATGPNVNRLSWRLSGLDAADFSISSAGQLTFRSTPNFESPADSDRDNIYELMVVARSGSIQDEVSVIVEVINVDEEGNVALSPQRGNVGTRITATLTDPDGDISGIDWEWERSRDGNVGWRGIPGANSNAYTSEADDAGHYLRAVAYYSDAQGAGKSASGRTSAAVLTDDDGVVTLSSNRLAVGDRVTASLRDPDGNVRNVIWQWASSATRTSGWSDIPGATAATYTVAVADVGSFLRATATYDDGDGLGKSAEAVTTVAVVEDDDGVVTLSSTTPSVGVTITATLADPDGGVTGETWQWASSSNGTANWTDIAGANSATYTVVTGDLGKFLRATVYYDDAADAGKSAEAITTAAVTEDDDGVVTLSPSSPQFSDRVTATLTDPDGGVTGVTWSWAISSNGTTNWIPIIGANSATYTVVEANVGSYLRATASYTDAAGPGKSADAVTAAAVTEDDDGTVTLSTSAPQVGSEVTALLSDPDRPITDKQWQWERSSDGLTGWTNIDEATSASYTPGQSDAGDFLRVTVTYNDSVGTGKSAQVVTSSGVAQMALLSTYDANRNGSIERSEAVNAVSDYFNDEISKSDVLDVLVLYFSS